MRPGLKFAMENFSSRKAIAKCAGTPESLARSVATVLGRAFNDAKISFSIASNIIVVAASDIWLGPEALAEAYRAMNKRDE